LIAKSRHFFASSIDIALAGWPTATVIITQQNKYVTGLVDGMSISHQSSGNSFGCHYYAFEIVRGIYARTIKELRQSDLGSSMSKKRYPYSKYNAHALDASHLSRSGARLAPQLTLLASCAGKN
jgi:hypothetical protein